MSHESWDHFLAAFRVDHKTNFYASRQDLDRFTAFVAQLPPPERIPLLLHAYDRYRASAACGLPTEADFEVSCYSILISTILWSGIQPNRHEAAQILRRSYHRCGHGSDVEPPLTLAERAFRNQPYSMELFDAVRAYRETLRISRGSHAANIKRKLGWVMWHDPRFLEKKCYTRRIQQAIHAMDSKSAFHWQWLLRNVSGGMQAAPGKAWMKDGKKRLARIGEEEFLAKLDDWFTFPEGEVNLSAAGSVMLRLLVWYGALVDVERSLPVLVRLVQVHWNRTAPVGKAMAALSWMLRTYGESRFAEEARVICSRWAGESAEVKRLEKLYFPYQSEARAHAEQAERNERSKQLREQRESTLRAFREYQALLHSPDFPAGRYIAALKKLAEPETAT